MSTVQDNWLHVLKVALNNNFLMNTPKGKTAYAWGVAYALERLEGKCDPEEWEKLRVEASEFANSYMTNTDG